MASWKDVIVLPDTPLGDAIARIDASGLQVALVLSQDGALLGVLTDGNIRRAILAGKSLSVPVSEVMNPHPTSLHASAPHEEMLALMRRKAIHHLPLVDDSGQVADLITLDDLIGVVERPNWVVIMAGGLGTRLLPLTEQCPKPLLPVCGKPILETILESFAEQGFKRIFLSVNYKADMIRNHFGSGERWGVHVQYLNEDTRLGTAGALSLLPEKPTAPIVVMNGDLLTLTNYNNLLHFHNAQGAAATMAVRDYGYQVPYGVVRLDGACINGIEEKPTHKCFVNAGIYALSPDALEHMPVGTFYDMPTLFDQLIAAGKTTAAYPLREYWLDIGRLEELEKAQQEWTTHKHSGRSKVKENTKGKKPETRFEHAVLEQYFSGMKFTDQREKEVFLSYLRGFSILFFDPSVKNIIEIGGGQSTAIFALMAERFGCRVSAIDMNPEAIEKKVRNAEICRKIYKNVSFLKGLSISCSDLASYYSRDLNYIGGVPFHEAVMAADDFIETSLDGRKEPFVLNALDVSRLDVSLLETALVNNGKFRQSLLDIYRNKGDEFDYLPTVGTSKGLLAETLDHGEVDAVFLDSGEFSSLPEWEIVSDKLRVGGYVILHDIFFPKSFKNWLVCSSIRANPKWQIIYCDRSTPQGLMVARRHA